MDDGAYQHHVQGSGRLAVGNLHVQYPGQTVEGPYGDGALYRRRGHVGAIGVSHGVSVALDGYDEPVRVPDAYVAVLAGLAGDAVDGVLESVRLDLEVEVL